jgi:hypothetical protein
MKPARPADADFFTVGYTGRSLQEILDAIVTVEARSLIDIRHIPVSMYRPELSKKNLQKAVEERGLAYVHARELGVPREIRAMAAGSGTRDTIWTWYDENVVTTRIGKNLHWFRTTSPTSQPNVKPWYPVRVPGCQNGFSL